LLFSDGSAPKAAPKPAAPVPAVAPAMPQPGYYSPYNMMVGKKRDEIFPTATAMPSSASPTMPSSDSFEDDNFMDTFDDKSKTAKAA